jgi:hypothetical protein
MGNNHDHSHDGSTYYVEQLCTIGICGAMGVVTLLLYQKNLLSLMLVPGLHWMVVAGGIALLVLVGIRALAVWFSVGKPAVHQHDHACGHTHTHEHGPDCAHEHEHHHEHAHEHSHHHEHGHGPGCDHEHHHDHEHAVAASSGGNDDGHGHEHGWGPWRYAVLLLPVVLFFLDLPGASFSAGFSDVPIGELGDPTAAPTANTGVVVEVTFKELQNASMNSDQRQAYEGRTIQIRGQYVPSGNSSLFTLRRYKMNCCAADAIPLNAVIMIDPKWNEKLKTEDLLGKWVLVTGQVQFRKRKDEMITVIFVQPSKDQPLDRLIEAVAPDNNPYVI